MVDSGAFNNCLTLCKNNLLDMVWVYIIYIALKTLPHCLSIYRPLEITHNKLEIISMIEYTCDMVYTHTLATYIWCRHTRNNDPLLKPSGNTASQEIIMIRSNFVNLARLSCIDASVTEVEIIMYYRSNQNSPLIEIISTTETAFPLLHDYSHLEALWALHPMSVNCIIAANMSEAPRNPSSY